MNKIKIRKGETGKRKKEEGENDDRMGPKITLSASQVLCIFFGFSDSKNIKSYVKCQSLIHTRP